MTALGNGAPTFSNSQSAARVRAAKLLRLLAVVDGTESTNRIVDFITAFSEGRAATEAVVLNVQSKRLDARLRGYQNFKKDEIDDRLINELALPILNSVTSRLEKAGILCSSKAEIGDPVTTILRCAAENACNVILVGAQPSKALDSWMPDTMRAWLRADLALRLIALAPASIVVVK
ncbi:universal stress protein [Bradyrhizobium sp. WSM 1738]|uniref:universal stress protein n=1 Tax=Bradyrhizobium hereditatis TaxID=2821405 RepID=UPI001CE3A608|nr:universal stress protein [Bradyrhizobium hereditatis]MCA6114677.1 universal stress protein [Bradyrhizobium hereditatis]